jgi:hypothetical protein
LASYCITSLACASRPACQHQSAFCRRVKTGFFAGGAMGFTTDADDWQVLCISILGLASVWLHSFLFLISTVKTADITARFRLSAFGSWIGGGSAGWALPGISDWSDLSGKRPFSAQTLYQCAATVVTATVGAGANVGPCLISGYYLDWNVSLRGSGRSGAFRW